MRRRILLLICLFAPALAAQDEPIVRVEVEPTTVRIGESLAMRVTVLVPTFFVGPPVYPDFELPNAVTRLPPDSSFPTSQRVGGETWSGIVREYRVYPLAPGDYRLDGERMRVSWADPGSDPVLTSLTVPPVRFRGTVPAGAQDLDPYLAGSDLRLSVQVEGNDGPLTIGDAVVLTYRAELEGLPSLFLPPLAPTLQQTAGTDLVAVHADAPRFVDSGAISERTERVTLIFERAGQVQLPGISLVYWNTADQELRSVATAPISFEVVGAPVMRPTREDRPHVFSLIAMILLLALLVSIAAHRWIYPRLKANHIAWQGSEAGTYAGLRKALRAGREARVYRALLRWLDELERGLEPTKFAARHGDPALVEDLAKLSACLFDAQAQGPDLRRLAAGLGQARQRIRSERPGRERPALPPLNP